MPPLLQVKDLRTHFYTEEGLVKAVDGVTYDVQEGETLALVGESGCGKSISALSLLKLIPIPPGRIVSGEVLFEGEDLMKLSEDEIRKIRGNRISMVFQEPMTSLNPVLTIGKQMTEALELHLKLNKEAAIAEGKQYMFFSPWVIGVPAVALVFLVLAINLVGDGMRDVTAPENRT